jgi:hypothetical protein
MKKLKNIDKFNIYNSNIYQNISIKDYLERFVKYTNLEFSTLVIFLIYIDRICSNTDKSINDNNAHKYFFYFINNFFNNF